MTQRTIPLVALASALRLPHRTAVRWYHAHIINGTNRGRGPTNGIRLSRDEAMELVAACLLRRAGLTLQRLRPLLAGLRAQGKCGRDAFASGSLGGRALLDGAGDAAPLRELSGQAVLPMIAYDLRPLRAQAEQLVRELERESVGAKSA